jgi:beta-glucosidase-like glycosyl hydrolase/CubicO group peptidase (beta-lactamase class C family)
MSLEEKAGQMVMVLLPGAYSSAGREESDRVLRLVRDLGIGGMVLSYGDVYEVAHLLNRLQSMAKVPLLISADLERGLAMRVRRGTPFPDAMALGATRRPDLAYEVAKAIAREARALGIHQNFAPDADVNTNPGNPVINTRSFGDDVTLVQNMVSAFVRGTADGGMLSTAKHFPGHGDTRTDSHLELPRVPLTRSRLDSVELSPFRSAIQSGTNSVMVAHLGFPAIEKDESRPASLSASVITDLLRRDLGFSGLVITDAMEMQGVVQGYSVGQSTVMAIQAGTDIVLLPLNADVAINAIIAAVRGGTLSEERINSSVKKILEAKQLVGLDRNRLTDERTVDSVVGIPEHWRLAREVARHAVTLLKDDESILPLRREEEKNIIAVILTDTDESRSDINRPMSSLASEPTGAYFTQLLSRRLGRIGTMYLSPSSDQGRFEEALRRMKRADLVLMPTFVKVRTSSGRIGLPERLRGFLVDAEHLRKPTVVVAFGTPYVAAHFSSADVLLCAYGDGEPSVEATAEALCGEIDLSGKLPVTVPGAFPFGSGIEKSRRRLRLADPAEAGFDPSRLRRIDGIVQAGIRDSAFSAAQVAVVKDGLVVWDRAYGTYTYEAASREITTSSIFDLASVTKVIGTTTAIMKLYDTGKISLDDSVKEYLPQFADGPKTAITNRHLLLHRGGFPPFRKFWEFCPTPEAMLDSVFATPLVAHPGDTTIYSDLGFITLGKVVETVAGMPLSAYLQREFFGPLGMSNTMYTPPADIRARAVPTEYDSVWRKRLIQGTVHDENADFLGGVSGHAGIFSTAGDLTVFAQMLLSGGVYDGVRYLRDSTIATFVGQRTEGQERFLGWDMRSLKGSSAGTLFSPASFGHTGFTGTSIWIDPERKLAVVFLTNRVHPTRANSKLFRIRPALHDCVVSALR